MTLSIDINLGILVLINCMPLHEPLGRAHAQGVKYSVLSLSSSVVSASGQWCQDVENGEK